MGSRKRVKICTRLELRDKVPENYIGTIEELYLGYGMSVKAKVTKVRYSEILKTYVVEFTWSSSETYRKMY